MKLPRFQNLAAMLEDRSNDLTEPALRLAPVIREVLTALEEAPGLSIGASLGSGATCFGLFDDLSPRWRRRRRSILKVAGSTDPI